jgi:hypothetical protein
MEAAFFVRSLGFFAFLLHVAEALHVDAVLLHLVVDDAV